MMKVLGYTINKMTKKGTIPNYPNSWKNQKDINSTIYNYFLNT